MIAHAEDPTSPCLYVEGVGVNSISGKVFGYGVKSRVLEGYKYLAKHWSPDRGGGKKDEIYLYGFSRGAFEARLLAGMLAHCGLVNGQNLSEHQLDDVSEEAWRLACKVLRDVPDTTGKVPLDELADAWNKRLEQNRAATKNALKSYHFHAVQPEINFMGLWDTVPGMQFDRYNKSQTAFEARKREYKVRPYPNTKVIAHALALDEKRTKFSPLLVGPPLDSNRTKVYEVWFPGAHADVGGGYKDSNDMAGITFNWMEKIAKDENMTWRQAISYADATSLRHLSEEDFPNNFGSKKVNRVLPEMSYIDKTVFIRASHSPEKFVERKKTVISISYAPEIHIYGHEPVRVTGNARSYDMMRQELGGSLRLNDSAKSADAQKESIGKPLTPEQMIVPTVSTGNVSGQAEANAANKPPVVKRSVALNGAEVSRSR